MQEATSRRVGRDMPSRSSDLDQRDDIPGSGEMPKSLRDLAAENAIYVHGKGAEAPRLKAEEVFSNGDGSAYRVQLGEGLTEGLPLQFADQCSPSDLDVDDERELDACRPEWATLSFNPRSATGPSVPYMKRRNGRSVRPHFVNPPDDRTLYIPNTWPWILAGQVEVTMPGLGRWMATGALVGKSAVLTSSHVVPWGVFKICTVKFTPGYFLGKSILGEGVFSYCTGARGFSDYSQGDDMAVLRLSTPLGDNDALGYFGYKTYNDAWEGGDYWSLIGYPGTWKGVYLGGGYPTRESGIIITDDDDDGAGLELEHTGDSTDGNSGGPLWGWWGESPRVIGVQSGSEISYLGECNNLAAGGPALSKLIKYARNNW